MPRRSLRLILNGKKAGRPEIRRAVDLVRKDGHLVDVRVTWEGGDARRFAAEALGDGVDVIVAGGGDGTVNEVVNGMITVSTSPQSAMAVMPLGSANDFARGCGINIEDPVQALGFAATAAPTPIDVGRVNDRFFLNAIIAGFGAEVTFKTSERMKHAIGGVAYGLTGILMALRNTIYSVHFQLDGGDWQKESWVFSAIGNGVQAGGVRLTPRAKLNDGLLDVLTVPDFLPQNLPALLQEAQRLETTTEPTEFITYRQVVEIQAEADQVIPISPDGEEMYGTHFEVSMLKRCLPFILPPGAPLLPD